MDARDYDTYVSLFNHMVRAAAADLLAMCPDVLCRLQANFMRKPNIIVHLDVKPEESLRRIKMRCNNSAGCAV